MTNRERLLKVLHREIPDCVPVAPDFSYMIPAKMTGKPFWDIFLYNDPPIWEAYIDCAKYFKIDAFMDGYFPLTFDSDTTKSDEWVNYIVKKDSRRIITQAARKTCSKLEWASEVIVYHVADPPTPHIAPEKIGLPAIPEYWEPIEGQKKIDIGPDGFNRVKEMIGDQGLIGVFLTFSNCIDSQEKIFEYFDNPAKYEKIAEERIYDVERRFENIMRMKVKPDFFCVGGSGTMVYQTEEMFRRISFPAVKRAIELASNANIPTHMHSCGPERKLVEIMANDTQLTVIDPLEIPSMGDCILADLKREFGHKIVLKGNLHTTDIMLNGSTTDVINASKRAIDDAAEGGGFILSTGDQCGRDTPFENLFAMIDVARDYGKYS